MRKSTHDDYRERMVRLLKFIENNLSREITISEMAAVICFSEFHFQRLFAAMIGESAQAYIRRLRLERAATYLCMGTKDITEIALDALFQTSSSFSKAFKKHFGVSPTEYRTHGVNLYRETSLSLFKTLNEMEESMEHKVIKLDSFKVVSIRKNGPYQKAAEEAWREICEIGFSKGWAKPDSMMIGISRDNPDVTEADKLRYDACIRVEEEPNIQAPLVMLTIEGGVYAVFRHKGPYEKLIDSYRYIYGKWVPESGRELKDTCEFEHYINCPETTAPEELLTDIYLPLK